MQLNFQQNNNQNIFAPTSIHDVNRASFSAANRLLGSACIAKKKFKILATFLLHNKNTYNYFSSKYIIAGKVVVSYENCIQI